MDCMSQVALYTFGLIDPAAGQTKMTDFVSRVRDVFAASDSASGFLGRAEKRPSGHDFYVPGDNFGPWGLYAIPLGLPDFAGHDPTIHVATLSLWRDTASARHFVYSGLHRDALKIRHDWFLKGPWPGYVLWNVTAGVVPSWEDGVGRLQDLARFGETSDHYTFGFR